LYLGINFSYSVFNNLKLFHFLFSESLGSFSRFFQRLHFKENSIVVDDVDDICAEERCGL